MKKILFSLFKKISNACTGKGLRKIPGATPIQKLIYQITKPRGIILITCQENKMYLNTEDTGLSPSLLIRRIYEPYETELFKKLIKSGMVVVDIGANIGYYTLLAAKLVGNNGRVYAFEPEPTNYRFLIKNIELNRYKNIKLIQKAVSDKHGKARIFLDKHNLGMHSLAEANIQEKAGFMEVEMVTLDDFFKKHKNRFY